MRFGDKMLMLPQRLSLKWKENRTWEAMEPFSLLVAEPRLTFSYSFQIIYKRRRLYYSFSLVPVPILLLYFSSEGMQFVKERHGPCESGDGFLGEPIWRQGIQTRDILLWDEADYENTWFLKYNRNGISVWNTASLSACHKSFYFIQCRDRWQIESYLLSKLE